MEVWELPTSIVVGGIKYDIRTDFRAILDILKTFNDPEFENDEKWIVALTILYADVFEAIFPTSSVRISAFTFSPFKYTCCTPSS